VADRSVKNISLQYGLDVNLDKSKLMIVDHGEKVLLRLLERTGGSE
jgi:hypothetical protein